VIWLARLSGSSTLRRSRSTLESYLSEARERWERFRRQPRAPLVLLGVVSLLSLAVRLAWISNPRILVFDENYYVSAARKILGVRMEPDQLYASAASGLDPNFAHPPLGKMLIALGIRAFGDAPLGWRFTSLLFGTYAILAIYWLARTAGFSSWISLGASSLMAADPMFFVHGRVGMLEILVLTFMLVGAAVYLSDRPAVAGVIVGVGACIKLVTLFLLAAFLAVELLRLVSRARSARRRPKDKRDEDWLRRLLPRRVASLALTGVTAVVTYLGLLQLLDMRFTNFDNSIEHTRAMLTSFESGGLDKTVTDLLSPSANVEGGEPALWLLAGEQAGPPSPQPVNQQPADSPVGPVIRQKGQNLGFAAVSEPWQWLLNEKPILYYRAPTFRGEVRSWSLLGQRTLYATHFHVLVNPAIILLALPALGFSFYRAWQKRRGWAFLPAAWFVGVWGMYVLSDVARPQASGHLYYILIVMPAIYIAVAQLFTAQRLKRFRPLYGGVVALFFLLNFPFKTWGGV
jgi:hypothetical protein